MVQPANRRLVTEEALHLWGEGHHPHTVDESAGRTVKVWDYLNNREQLIYGETGERDITAMATVPVAGKLLVSRSNNRVTVRFDSFRTLGESMLNLLYLPSGFRPKGTTNFWLTADVSAGTPDRSLQIYASGNFRVNSAASTDEYRQSVSFETADPWPTALPGVAA